MLAETQLALAMRIQHFLTIGWGNTAHCHGNFSSHLADSKSSHRKTCKSISNAISELNADGNHSLECMIHFFQYVLSSGREESGETVMHGVP